MKGLIVKGYWLESIFKGLKPWEIRGSNCKNIRGRIALIESGTKMVMGTVEIIDSIRLTYDDLLNNKDKHCIQDLSIITYKKSYAWVLANPIKFENPIPYKHKQGCVIWVNLTEV